MMGCGMAHFGRRGLETTRIDEIWSKILSPGVWTRGFQTPPTKMSYTAPHHIPKYEI